MNTLPANELKRHGVIALEEGLKLGPVHIIKSNRPACVVLREEDFAQLTQKAAPQTSGKSLWEWLEKPATGTSSRKTLDAWLEKERDSWRQR
jgi:hypothetical protein